MKTFMISLSVLGSLSASAETATCFLRRVSPVQYETLGATGVEFNKRVVSTRGSFTLKSDKVNPDTSVEYVEIDGVDRKLCKDTHLFDDSYYAGVKTVCKDQGILTTVTCLY